MSESDKFEQRRKEALKRKQQLNRMKHSKLRPSTKKKIAAVAASVVALVIAAVIVFCNLGVVRRQLTAVTIGDQKVSAAEFNYYYTQQAISTYNTYYNYFGGSYVPFDTTKKLSAQTYYENTTWADYLTDSSISTIQQVKTLIMAARAEGFELSEEGKQNVETNMTTLGTYASNAKTSLDNYLSRVYGRGVNAELIRQILTETQLANEYDSALFKRPEYTEEQISAYFDSKAKDSFTYVDIRYYAFNKVAGTDKVKEVTLEEAKAAADKVVDGVASEEDYSKNLVAYMKEKAEDETKVVDTSKRTAVTASTLSSTDKNLSEWAFSADRKAGDVEVIANANGTGYYAVYMAATAYRYDYNTIDIREIYLAFSDADSEEKTAAVKEAAEALLESWKAGEHTEDSFAALADEKSESTALKGGLLQKASKADDDLSKWAFDPERQYGDTEVIKGQGGYYILYWIGQNQPYWMVQTENALRSEDYDKVYAEIAAKYEVEKHGFGLMFTEEPFLNRG